MQAALHQTYQSINPKFACLVIACLTLLHFWFADESVLFVVTGVHSTSFSSVVVGPPEKIPMCAVIGGCVSPTPPPSPPLQSNAMLSSPLTNISFHLRSPAAAVFPTTRNLCTPRGHIIFMLAWRPRFIVSHVEEVRLRTRKRIVLLCPDEASVSTSTSLFATAEGRQLFGEVQAYYVPHSGNRATLTNGYFMLIAAGHYIRHVLADDCRAQLGLPPLSSSRIGGEKDHRGGGHSPSAEEALVVQRMDAVKVFVFDPVRSILCSNPFRSISRHRLAVVPVPVASSPFYAYHYFLLSKVWTDDYSGIGMKPAAAPSNPEEDDAGTEEEDDVSGKTVKSIDMTSAAPSEKGRSSATESTNTWKKQASFAASSSAIGGSAAIVAEVSYLLEKTVQALRSTNNFTTVDDSGPKSPKLALGIEPMLTGVVSQWLRSTPTKGGIAPRQLQMLQSVQYTSTTYCPQFQEAARFCRRYPHGARPDVVVDYHHCDPRGPSPLTHHVRIPSQYSNESHSSMLQGMCHTLYPYSAVRLAASSYLAAALEATPVRYVNAWRAWQPVSLLREVRRTLSPAAVARSKWRAWQPVSLLREIRRTLPPVALPPVARSKLNVSFLGLPHQLADEEHCTVSSQRRNVVITVAANYHAGKVKWLLRTFDRHRRQDDDHNSCTVMIIFITRHSKEYDKAIEGKKGIFMLKLRDYLTTVPKGTLKLLKCPMVLARIELLRHILLHEVMPKWNPRYILMVDARDTYFQANPFTALTLWEEKMRAEGHLQPFQKEFVAMPGMSYGWGNMELRVPQRYLINRQWTSTLFPETLFDAMRALPLVWEDPTTAAVVAPPSSSSSSSTTPPPRRPSTADPTSLLPAFNASTSYQPFPALCGGMYFGTAKAMIDFFDLFVTTSVASPNPCLANDQGLLLGLVPFGISIAKFPHPVLILDPLQSHFSNEPDYGMSLRTDASAIVSLNCHGEPLAVLHQFVPNWQGMVAQLKRQLAVSSAAKKSKK